MSNAQLVDKTMKRILTQRLGKNVSNFGHGIEYDKVGPIGLDFLCIELLHWSKYIDVVTMNLDKNIDSLIP